MSHSLFKGVVGIAVLLSMSCGAMQRNMMLDEARYLEFRRHNHVQNHDVDSTLRKINADQLHKYFAAGCLIRAKQLNNGDYVLRTHVPGKGGGVVGAAVGATVGYAAVSGAAYGTIGFISSFFGPAAPFVAATAGAALTPAIAAASHVAAVGCGRKARVRVRR